MADGRTPGDGKSSPFGNPAGGDGGSGPMTDFTRQPGGAGSSGPTPRDFTVAQGQTTQRPTDNAARSTVETPSGGLLPLVDRADAGVGSVGNGAKPFRL